jgi:hypothetical protein
VSLLRAGGTDGHVCYVPMMTAIRTDHAGVRNECGGGYDAQAEDARGRDSAGGHAETSEYDVKNVIFVRLRRAACLTRKEASWLDRTPLRTFTT